MNTELSQTRATNTLLIKQRDEASQRPGAEAVGRGLGPAWGLRLQLIIMRPRRCHSIKVLCRLKLMQRRAILAAQGDSAA